MPRPAQDRSTRPARRFSWHRGPLVVAIAALVSVLLAAGCDSSTSAEHGSSTTSGPSSTSVAGDDPATTAGAGVPGSGDPTTTDRPAGADPDDPSSTDLPADPTGVVTGGTTVSQTSTPQRGTFATDVRTVDFADHTFPSDACSGVIDRPPTGGYRLVDGEVRWGGPAEGSHAVALDPDRSYGDVNGDGVRDVTLTLECTRGTRPIPVGWVYTVEAGRPVALAEVDLDPDSLPLRGVLDTELAEIRIQGASVATEWAVYLDGDAVCCPTTTATVSWTWNGGELAAGAPVVRGTPADR